MAENQRRELLVVAQVINPKYRDSTELDEYISNRFGRPVTTERNVGSQWVRVYPVI